MRMLKIINSIMLKEMEIMNEVAIAKKVVPEILKDLGPTFVELEKPICDAIVQYGCCNQLAIRDIAVKTVPEFADVSGKFFEKMWSVIEAENNNDSKNTEKLMEVILKSQHMDITAQVEECRRVQEEEFKRKQQRMEMGRKVAQSVGRGAVVLGGMVLYAIISQRIGGMYGEYQKTKRKKIQEIQKTKRTEIWAGTVRDTTLSSMMRNK